MRIAHPQAIEYAGPMSNERGRRIESADEFESAMETGGRILHRDKKVSRSLALIMLLSTVLFLAASVAYALGWGADVSTFWKVLTYALTPLFPYVLLTGTVVRTVVTTREVQVKLGLWGPRIAVETITSCEPLTSEQIRQRQQEFMRSTHDGPAKRRRKFWLLVPGRFTEAVWLEWTDSDGTAHAAAVGSDDPGALAAAIQDARQADGGVRIETDPAQDGASEEELAEIEEEINEAVEERL